jgi:hypothetical protein
MERPACALELLRMRADIDALAQKIRSRRDASEDPEVRILARDVELLATRCAGALHLAAAALVQLQPVPWWKRLLRWLAR